jgi:hypothetical protein
MMKRWTMSRYKIGQKNHNFITNNNVFVYSYVFFLLIEISWRITHSLCLDSEFYTEFSLFQIEFTFEGFTVFYSSCGNLEWTQDCLCCGCSLSGPCFGDVLVDKDLKDKKMSEL